VVIQQVYSLQVKVKSKGQPRTGHEGPEREQRYSCTLSLTLALDGGGWSTPRPSRFTPGKQTRYTLCRRLGGPQGRSGRMRKISPPPGFDLRTVQPVASRYTYCATPVFQLKYYAHFSFHPFPAHIILLHLVDLISFGEYYKPKNSLLKGLFILLLLPLSCSP
jgi:hypothetical protein